MHSTAPHSDRGRPNAGRLECTQSAEEDPVKKRFHVIVVLAIVVVVVLGIGAVVSAAGGGGDGIKEALTGLEDTPAVFDERYR